MRLTGGVDKGHSLVSPRGIDIRPTSDRVRESLFSILGPLDGEVVLDLFAGAGTLGLEALSRGASSAWFVDRNPRSLKALQESVARLGYDDRVHLLRRDAASAVAQLAQLEPRFDLVFLDPPYGSPDLEPTLRALGGSGLVTPDGRVVAEHDREDVLEPRYGALVRTDSRRYGRTILSFYQPEKASL
jgi:16S rRNA (guanine(966)-N(2))-methyltransferase RsmD